MASSADPTTIAVTAEAPTKLASKQTWVWIVIAGATLLGFALRLYLLLRPGYLLGVTQYDDGEYVGSAIRLADGMLPYRDFAFVQPPAITVLLLPVGLLARALGTDTGFAIARLLTVCVGAASVTLGGLLVRHRGLLATAITCGVLAIFPDAIGASYTVFLEPYLVLFCLIGALIMFAGDEFVTGRRRVLWGGVVFGLAGAIKVWAIFPVLVLLALLWYRESLRRGLIFVGGVIAGFCLPVAFFFLEAPDAFINSVIGAQLHQANLVRAPVRMRLFSLFGLADVPPAGRHILAATVVILAYVAVVFLGGWLYSRRAPPPIDWFAVATLGLTLAAFMLPGDYSPHYATFFALFLALSLALPTARLADVLSGRLESSSRPLASSAVVILPLTGLVAVGVVLAAVHQFHYEAPLRTGGPPIVDDRYIPAGACVLTDESSFTVAGDRFISRVPGCGTIVDAIATDMSLSRGRTATTGAGQYPAVDAAWMSAFEKAEYVWLNCGPPRAPACDRWTNRRIPWTDSLVSYFTRNFRQLPQVPGYLYVRVHQPS
jgi:hypothetical protein